MTSSSYIGRFAPSPSGPLHAGSLVAAMASYLDARAHDGKWLLRIEDIDEARTAPGATDAIMQCLGAFGMRWDGGVTFQSRRKALYREALERLGAHAYACGCSRREIADSRLGIARDGAAVYPGTCRQGLAPGRTARAIRMRTPDAGSPDDCIRFEDRWVGPVTQYLALQVGDFVLKRADGFWAYQMAVVVDDADQGVTHVVRGADLLDSTGRQIYLQRMLHLTTPRYMHVPVVSSASGEKLSKQTGAQALDPLRAEPALIAAASFLGISVKQVNSVDDFWRQAIAAWRNRFVEGRPG
jgi:glutamyl-Q tRNA(Asp) synthetase